MTRSTHPPLPFWGQVLSLLQVSRPILYSWRIGLPLGVLIVLSIVTSSLLVWESIQQGEFISALAARNRDRFERSVTIFISILVANSLLLSMTSYLRDRVSLLWRQGLTRHFVETYLHDRRYYRLTLPSQETLIDNPDQRMSEDIALTTGNLLNFGVIALDSVVQLLGFIGVLWVISRTLTGFLAVYAITGTAIAIFFFGKRLTRINTDQLKYEANFRFSLINLRENAESIAFYRGQQAEGFVLNDYFTKVVNNFTRLIRAQFGLDIFQNSYQYLTFILPSVILAPSILAGQLEVGAILQSQAAFDNIWLSLSLVIVQFEQLTTLAASIGRLGVLSESFQTLTPLQEPSIEPFAGDTLAVENLTVFTPDGKRSLCEDLSFSVPIGTGLLIIGRSGVGKSALLRTLSGLWTPREGILKIPTDILFLPQQPYLTLGSLRQQLLYPNCDETLSHDFELTRILEQVDLPYLAQLSLHTQDDWSQRLSLGEQQRLSFARLLLQRPTYAILDESTSVVTEEQEKNLYSCLRQAGITPVSVGHRRSLLSYHSQVLTLHFDRTWILKSNEDYNFA